MPHPSLNFTPPHAVSAVDVLIAGDVLRIVLDGAPKLKAKSPMEALQELRAEHEDFRHFVINPPRGHEDIEACLLLPPFSSDAIRTVIIAEHFGYAPVAGTLMLASAAALIETGQIAAREPETSVTFDTAHGKMDVVATVKNGRCLSLRWLTNRPKVIVHGQLFSLQNERTVSATVVSSGLPYVVARAEDLGVSLHDPQTLGAAGAMLSRAAGQQLPLRDVGMEQDLGSYLVMVVGDITNQDREGAAQVQAAWVSETGDLSRMPTGTGALSVATYLTETGQLASGQKLEVTSPTGHTLSCQIDAAGASLEGSTRIISLVELIGDPQS
jgi:proline racemase